jgi:hypothetical protein
MPPSIVQFSKSFPIPASADDEGVSVLLGYKVSSLEMMKQKSEQMSLPMTMIGILRYPTSMRSRSGRGRIAGWTWNIVSH